MVGVIIGDMRRSKGFSWIATVAVHPDYQGCGIGTALIQACERQITTPRIRLSVRSSNEQAIRLYLRLGYQQTAKWTKYFKGGEDALVMEKELGDREGR